MHALEPSGESHRFHRTFQSKKTPIDTSATARNLYIPRFSGRHLGRRPCLCHLCLLLAVQSCFHLTAPQTASSFIRRKKLMLLMLSSENRHMFNYFHQSCFQKIKRQVSKQGSSPVLKAFCHRLPHAPPGHLKAFPRREPVPWAPRQLPGVQGCSTSIVSISFLFNGERNLWLQDSASGASVFSSPALPFLSFSMLQLNSNDGKLGLNGSKWLNHSTRKHKTAVDIDLRRWPFTFTFLAFSSFSELAAQLQAAT